MTTSDNELCICGEPSCPGCNCGSGCPYAPGHPEGTKATTPLESLIEAAEALLANMYDGSDCCDVCGQEPCAWFWDPFAVANQLLRIVPEKSEVPVGVFAIGERCKQRLEEGETLSLSGNGGILGPSRRTRTE
jgi:hypothetical protein